jgi:prepilin-type N-terminal cleavage/methylation domain-containing protein
MPLLSRDRSSTASARAFTLIELLVVISIISALMGILLPALGSARKTAQAIKCQNNLKTMMAAIHMYATDHRDYMPYTNSYSGEAGPNPVWAGAGWLYDRTKMAAKGWGVDPVGAEQEDVETGVLWYYIGKHEMYHCPIDIGPFNDDTVRPLTSYTMNRAMNAWNAKLPAFRLGDHRSNAVALWEADEDESGGYWNDGNNDPGQTVSLRHNNGGCLGVVDGSARQITIFNFFAMLDEKPGPLFCNPLTDDGTETGTVTP